MQEKNGKVTELSKIVSLLKRIELPNNKSIYSLPNDLVFVMNDNDAVSTMYGIKEGVGHEPHIFDKMIQFMKIGENFIEVGANYGDYSLQMARILGENAKVYAFEPSNVFKYLEKSLFLNELPNLVIENLAVLDQEMELWFIDDESNSIGNYMGVAQFSRKVQSTMLDKYFKDINLQIGAIRLDAQGAECRVLRGANDLIDSSPNLKLFIEWERHLVGGYDPMILVEGCLDNLINRGFVFLDFLNFNYQCNYQNYLITKDYILNHDIEFLAIRNNSLQELLSLYSMEPIDSNIACNATINFLLYDAARINAFEDVKNCIIHGADINYMSSSFNATSLHLATQNGNKEIVELLLDAGANTEVIASNGLTPLCIAVQNKDTDIAKLLMEHKADIECKFPSGANALYVSSYLGDTATAILLMQAGASQNITVNDINIVNIARQNGYAETAQLLEMGVEVFCQMTLWTGEETKYAGICEE